MYNRTINYALNIKTKGKSFRLKGGKMKNLRRIIASILTVFMACNVIMCNSLTVKAEIMVSWETENREVPILPL